MSSSDLDGRTFLASHLTVDGVEHRAERENGIRFGFTSGSFSGNAGCNSATGVYELDGARLVTSGVSVTEIGCPSSDLYELEELVVELMTGSPSVKLDDDRLVLSSESVTFSGLDQEVADPDRPLVGTVWSYASINAGTLVGKGLLEATVTFAAGGSVSVVGCHTATGTFVVQGDRVSITLEQPVGEPCTEEHVAREEAALLATLPGSHTITMAGAGASFVRDDGHSVGFRVHEGPAISPGPGPTTSIPSAEAPKAPFMDRTFVAASITIEGQPRSGSGEWLSVSLHFDTVIIEGGCNHISTRGYNIEDGRLIADEVQSTDAVCADELMELDERLKELLIGSATITLIGDRLVLSSDAITFDGLDRVVADPDRLLVGTTWAQEGLPGTPISGYAATLVLTPDGGLTFAGCQTVAGTYELERHRLTMHLDARAGEPCSDPVMATVEQEFLADLTGTFTVGTLGDHMSLASWVDGSGIHFRAASDSG